MSEITSKQTGMGMLSPKQTVVTVLAMGVWGLLISIMWLIGLPILFIILSMVVLGGLLIVISFVFIFNNERFDRSILWATYFVRELMGKTVTHQLTVDHSAIEKRIPIRIHEGGLIEYITPKNQWGALFRYHPAENRKESVEDTTARIEKVVHTFTNEMWASFHFSHVRDESTDIEDMMLDALNREGATTPQKNHVFGMYDHITTKTSDKTTTAFLMSLRIGEYKNENVARRSYMSSVPGLLKTMRDSGIYVVAITEEDEIIRELAQFAVLDGGII